MAIKLIKDLDFVSKINSTDAVTESGKNMLSRYRGFCYNNSATCGLVNNFINEARNYSFDDGLMSILGAVESYINENSVRWQLAGISEGICSNNSAYNILNKKGIQKVNKLIEMNENDVRAYIKAGVLKDIQYIPEVRSVCKSVYSKQIHENKHTVNFSVSNPVSFVETNELESKFMVNGVCFSINENGEISVSQNTLSDTGMRVSSHLAQMRLVGENLEYTYNTGLTNGKENKFVLSEGKIDFTNGHFSGSFTEGSKFREFIFSDSFAKALNIREAQKFAKIGQAIADVYENMNNICVLDNVKLFSCSSGAVVSVIESDSMVNVTLFNSFGKVNESNNYTSMKDAVVEMKNKYALDVETMFASRIASDIKEGVQYKVDESDEKNIRLLKIAEMSEQFKNDPVKLMILTEMAEEIKAMK